MKRLTHRNAAAKSHHRRVWKPHMASRLRNRVKKMFQFIHSVCQSQGLVNRSDSGMLVPICAYVCMSISLNLTVGILGELSLGHAGFMSVGAFSGIIAAMSLQSAVPNDLVRMIVALVVGAFFAAIVGFIVGIPVLRLRGDYLAIVTLAFGEIIKNVVNVVFLGRDSAGFHVSTKDSMSLGLEPGGQVLIKGPCLLYTSDAADD